jgi:Uma2 family endonuclease
VTRSGRPVLRGTRRGTLVRMRGPAKRLATDQDVIDAPENSVAELIDDELFLEPRPAGPHIEAASVLGMLIGPPFRLGRGGPGGWWIQDEPELHLGRHVVVPDLAGWRRDLHPDLDRSVAHSAIAPQWVCEVMSPSTQRKDRIKKLPLYAAHGVLHAWLVDPLLATLEVYRLRDGHWSLIAAHEGAVTIRAEPFEAVELALGELWVSPPET